MYETWDKLASEGAGYAELRAAGCTDYRAKKLRKKYKHRPDAPTQLNARELLARRKEEFKRTARVEDLRTIHVRVTAPELSLTVLGDPHLDDPGADLAALERDLEAAAERGDWLLCVGDLLNNWPNGSRLASKYADQETTEEQAHTLMTWLLAGRKWAGVVWGNHDVWGGPSARREAASLCGGRLAEDELAIQFEWPDGETFKVLMRHNFRGRSMWNELHGLTRAAQKDRPGFDLYLAGHIHTWGGHQQEGWTAALVRGYKVLDSYATRLGHAPRWHGASLQVKVAPGKVPALVWQ